MYIQVLQIGDPPFKDSYQISINKFQKLKKPGALCRTEILSSITGIQLQILLLLMALGIPLSLKNMFNLLTLEFYI
jgi:hypothetical protein